MRATFNILCHVVDIHIYIYLFSCWGQVSCFEYDHARF